MNEGETTVKCNICNKLYKMYAYYVGDQSACLKCRMEASENMNNQYMNILKGERS